MTCFDNSVTPVENPGGQFLGPSRRCTFSTSRHVEDPPPATLNARIQQSHLCLTQPPVGCNTFKRRKRSTVPTPPSVVWMCQPHVRRCGSRQAPRSNFIIPGIPEKEMPVPFFASMRVAEAQARNRSIQQ